MTIPEQIEKYANPVRAAHAQRFFKTGKGEYGEGDVFIGLSTPELRTIAKENLTATFEEIKELLYSPIHEFRSVALFILTYQYEKNWVNRDALVDFYLRHRKQVNNWDLVDNSAYKILGHYLQDKDRSVLYKLAKEDNLWAQRIAIITTLAFIKKKDFKDTLNLIELLLKHPHDLMHKANGWMLREIGKKDEVVLCDFLDKHLENMPRTTLRYAIERFEESKRKAYLKR